MKELANKYKVSLSILNNGIKELSDRKDAAIAVCRKLHVDPKKDNAVCELNDRLRPLIDMLNDLKEVTKEVDHYYDKGWWRNEALTCNQRKSRSFIYAGPTRY